MLFSRFLGKLPLLHSPRGKIHATDTARFFRKRPMLRSPRGTIHATLLVPRWNDSCYVPDFSGNYACSSGKDSCYVSGRFLLPKAAGSASLIYKSTSLLVLVLALDESVQSFSFKLWHHFRIRS